MQRWLSWSKAHDWKSCVRLITDREFESLPLREQERESLWFSFFFCKERAKAIFFSLDYFIPLRNSTEWGFTLDSSENGEEKTYVFSISLFHSAWGALFRTSVAVQGTQRGSDATPLRVPASRWSMADMMNFCLRTLEPISRAVFHNP